MILAISMTVSFAGCTFADLLPAVTVPDVPTSGPTAAPTEPVATSAPTEAVSETEPFDAVADLVSAMTLREKVGQLFVVRPDALDISLSQEQIDDAGESGVTELTWEIQETLKNYPVGGVVMFGKNILSPDQIAQFNEELQTSVSIPLFICVDEEGGSVSRLANHDAFELTRYKNAASIRSVEQARQMGNVIGEYLADYGFNVDFAPVADVNTNPDNPVIGDRAFSSDPETAAELASGVAQGLRQQGIIPTFKHFPGHGDTAEDSHLGLATTDKTLGEMIDCEWIPFREATQSDCVMVGHIAAPAVTGDQTPASMSYRMVTELLKNQLGFQGLVITDSLTMRAITESYTPAEAALTALEAGCDLLLMPNGLQEAFDGVVNAVENGTFPEEKLDETVVHILRFKQSHGLLSFG